MASCKHQIDISKAHIWQIALESIAIVIPLITDITLVRNKFLDEIARATTVIDRTHSATGVQ